MVALPHGEAAVRLPIIGFVAGAGLLQALPALPDSRTLCAFLVAGLLMLALRRRWWLACAGLMLGFCWAALLAHHALAPTLAEADEGADVTVVGVVDSLPFHFDRGVRFHFAVEQAHGASAPVPPKVVLAWYAGRENAAGQVRPGERWRFVVRLQRPHGNANPYVSVSC